MSKNTEQEFDIEVFDTKDGESVAVIRKVPATSLEEACQKVAQKKGYLWIGEPDVGACGGGGPYFAVNEATYRHWHAARQQPDASVEVELAVDISEVREGKVDEFRGLLQLFEYTQHEEVF